MSSTEMPVQTLSLQSAPSNNTTNVTTLSEVEGNAPVRIEHNKGLRASICFKLTFFIGFLVLLASGVPGIFLLLKAHGRMVGEIERRLITVSTLRQEQLREYLLSETEKIELISNRIMINRYLVDMNSVDKSLVDYDLETATSVISDFLHSGIYDREGKLQLSTHQSLFSDVLEHGELNAINKTGFKISNPVRTDKFGWTYRMSWPILQDKTMLLGVLVTFVNATDLTKLYNGRTGLERTGELLIGIPEGPGMVRFMLPPARGQNSTLFPRRGAMKRALNGEVGVLVFRDYAGVKVVAAYRPVGFMHWGLVAKIDICEAYSSVKSLQIVIISTIIVFAFAEIMASLGLAKVVSSPIVELKRAAVVLGQGDMTARVKKGTVFLRDEIGDLKDTFNSMANQLANHQMILEHKVRERTLDLAHANEGLAYKAEERRRVEVELEHAKDTAVAANRTKSEFLTNMSHEIRTPLNAIINFTELCLDTQVTCEQREHLNYVCFSAQHLLRLITDILDFSKIEAGRMEIEQIQFSLFDQVEQAVSVQAAPAFKNGLELCCRFDADVPDQLMGDPGRLLQIFVNLIGNAIKFTEKGEVIVSVSVKNKIADVFELLFGVRDTGLGIPKEKQSLLFQAFSQVDSSTQRVYGGTGLGLVISYRLAIAMGGDMWMESDGVNGHGSTFRFTAHFKVAPSYAVQSSPWANMFEGLRALVVDDNESSRSILVDLLKIWGMIVDGVGTVEDATCELVKASHSNKKYDTLLLDMWLHGGDASELISFLRTNGSCLRKGPPVGTTQLKRNRKSLDIPIKDISTKSKVVGSNIDGNFNNHKIPDVEKHSLERDGLSSVIMLTSVNHADVSRCLELGIIHHVSKPIKQALLVQALLSVLGSQDNTATLEEKTPKACESPPKHLHVLVVEDNAVNQRVMVILLTKWGHTSVLANNGEEAVEKVTKEEFDLILMDVQMPVCDGLQATARIRELEKTGRIRGNIPIIAMTAHAMPGDGERLGSILLLQMSFLCPNHWSFDVDVAACSPSQALGSRI